MEHHTEKTTIKKNQINLVVGDYIPLIQDHSSKINISSNIVHQNNSSLTINFDIHTIDSNAVNLLAAGIPAKIPSIFFTLGKFVASNLKLLNECWQQRNIINEFYRNLLSHFVYAYLDYNSTKTPLEQINQFLDDLDSSSTVPQVIATITNNLKNTHALIQSSQLNQDQLHVVVTNAANGKNLGGVATYGKGSAEEAFERVSDLFLRMLLEHSWGNYQVNILQQILKIFRDMLMNKADPITDQASSDRLVAIMLNLITKDSFEGYCLFYNAKDQAYRVHCNENILLRTSKTLISLDQLEILSPSNRASFLNTCYTNIHILSLASKDKRIIGSNPADAFNNNSANYDILFNDIKELIITIANKYNVSVDAILLPLGCGAFGNNPKEVATAIAQIFNPKNFATSDTSKIKNIFVSTFFDNYEKLHNEFLDKSKTFYNNRGMLVATSSHVTVHTKLQDITDYPKINQPTQNCAIIIPISENRNEIPLIYQNFIGKSSLNAIFHTFSLYVNENEYKQIVEIFRTKAEKQTLFKINAAYNIFNHHLYFIPLNKAESKNNVNYLTAQYKLVLQSLNDEDCITSVDFPLFGIGANNYSMEDSCQALVNALQKLQLPHLKTINIISHNEKEIELITKCLQKKWQLQQSVKESNENLNQNNLEPLSSEALSYKIL